ncbi:hypothetical protein KC845_02445 [Candidatus Kaiserbacteria bacterium]|nr:hypothetical protein [Candidatus Kaiserbacteria bacterium]
MSLDDTTVDPVSVSVDPTEEVEEPQDDPVLGEPEADDSVSADAPTE